MENYKSIDKTLTGTNIQTQNCFGCTSLKINDKQGNIYHGRTLEFSSDMIFNVAYHPVGTTFSYNAPDNKTKGLSYSTKYELLLITTPGSETINAPVEGVNSAGLSGSMNMKTDSDLPVLSEDKYSTSLHWALLIEWALANCSSVQEIKTKIKDISLWTKGLPVFLSNFHHIFYDTTGACLVVEVSGMELSVIDNPTGVLTNGPEFNWHITNLNNYTHLTNQDITQATLGGLQLKQPDTGIAASLLPSSDTAVGRFVRAVFYSSFALVQDSPQKAMLELSHIMNKFDRPKNMSRSESGEGGEVGSSSEYTEWTSLTDLKNKEMHVRTYYDLNYTKYSIEELGKGGKSVLISIVK